MVEYGNNQPIRITNKNFVIQGVLRHIKNNNLIYVFVPSTTGVRLGSQRIFIELAQALGNKGISSFCFDIPPFGDSFTKSDWRKGSKLDCINCRYSSYLEIVINYLTKNYCPRNILLVSISDGCIPVYYFALRRAIRDLILLSPDHINSDLERMDRSEHSNKSRLCNTSSVMGILDESISRLSCKIISGEKDKKLPVFKAFWEREYQQGNIQDMDIHVVSGADHSFFGWELKRSVEKMVCA